VWQPRLGGGVTLLAVAALTACHDVGGGHGDPDPVTTVAVSGVVADGPLAGAAVCYDLNDNAACDSGEPSATTDADGKYSLDIANEAAGQHAVIAEVPATAVDKDTGLPVGTAFTLKSPPSGSAGAQSVFVSPLTTLVVDVAGSQGTSTAEALAQVQAQLGLAASPLADFVASGDSQAGTLARVVNTVITDVSALADAAGVGAPAKAALLGSVTTGNLSALALLAGAASGTPAEVAQAVAAALKSEANINAGTIKAIADATLATRGAPPDTTPAEPFTSARRFRFTDANNYVVHAFVGDSSVRAADGSFMASEARAQVDNGVVAPFNRNTSYWVKSAQGGAGAWQTCHQGFEILRVQPATANAPQIATYCGASITHSRVAEADVAGRRMADVVAEIRASTLRDVPGAGTDANGAPKDWGPDPALLGDALFPDGARLQTRQQTSDVGDTERYVFTDVVRVAPATGVGTFPYRQPARLEEALRMSGDLVDPAASVTNLNTVFLDDMAAQPTDPGLRPIKRYRAALAPSGGAARFYACDVAATADASSRNCVKVGDGSFAIAAQGDARVLRFTAGYPAAPVTANFRQRLLVERSGGVFGGWRDLQRSYWNLRPNTKGWDALRTALALPQPQPPAAPAPGPFATLRNFTFADAANYSFRLFTGDNSVLDAQGYFLADEVRETRTAGNLVPFARNALYWTGASWFDCGSTGVGINRVNSVAPFDSDYCSGSYLDERTSSVTVTLNGTRMSDVVNNIRFYSTRDFAFDYANWGPSPAANPQLANSFFPAGSTMEYRGQLRKATPVAISTSATSRVRVPPVDPSVPFNTWPFATTLDEFIAKNPGDINGGPLNGATAFFVQGKTLAAAPSPEYTTALQWRVAFDANGQKARFYNNNISVATGFTTNYVKLLDTTYTIETVGGKRVLKFAAMPDGFEAAFSFQRMFAEHDGSVWYAFKDSVVAGDVYSIRLNRAATEALFRTLGIN
jgi:hypothetical protein